MFVVDISPRLIAVPGAWKFPSAIDMPEYTASLMRSFTATAADSQGRAILSGILSRNDQETFQRGT